ncbi:CHAT domain-containing protein [Limnofasciculus baicalensis]|uniref:CHAT domain-containing protein n=1 Tax=Limnofasciculus baicalensis BBK-W-15 TaxID=2699891 RepID=A0AAE3GNH8_9CYAN|nr:CHAT domain-containing protein [Limnofasciculus baicalensis]MCP2727013.1 CHAT domain-containing protein [Limnofasciculus baicalensis BBK-W-15]
MYLRYKIFKFAILLLSAFLLVVSSPLLFPTFYPSSTAIQAQTLQSQIVDAQILQSQTLQDGQAEADRLYEEGSQQLIQGQFKAALQTFQQLLVIYRKVGDRSKEGSALNNIGLAYQNLGQYGKALDYLNQALVIKREMGDRAGIGKSLSNIGQVYDNLGQYEQALEYYKQALSINRQIGDRAGEGKTLSNISGVYYSAGENQEALNYYQEALTIIREVKDRSGEGTTLSNIGVVYASIGKDREALDYYQQALTIIREVGDRASEGATLNNIAGVYNKQKEYQSALDYYQQALAIQREVGDRVAEGRTLNNIGLLLEAQNQTELAIVFLKQSINLKEAIRQDIRGLAKEEQQSFTQTIAHTYRKLATLLFKQDRILEAQRVLDLLKVQELDDYFNNVSGNNNTAQGLPNLLAEENINQGYQAIIDKEIELGKELSQLRQIKPENRTPQQEQRISELVKSQQESIKEFNNFIKSPEVNSLIKQLNQTNQGQNLDLAELISLQDNLKKLQQNAVLLYPLILDDRLELILTTPDSPPIRHTVNVTKTQLNQAIVEFRKTLLNSAINAKTPAKKLYDWLIKPLEEDLKAAGAKTIIYAPDGALRYIPLAALYDGEEWLIQRYRINNITAASLTEINTQPQPQLKILAGAFANGSYSIHVGNEVFNFTGLPFAKVEVDNLAQIVPNTTKLIDTAFTPEAIISQMDNYNVVHFATHGVFVDGTPEESFILFGDGKRVTLTDIENWKMKNVDLVVLSACETGLGGKLGNGEEILGLGYQIQRAGARATIASLWTVNDSSTQLLMNGFYTALESGKITKAEALRQAQIALITKDDTALGVQRGAIVSQRRQLREGLQPDVANHLNHPYYWAPFILIGNGL